MDKTLQCKEFILCVSDMTRIATCTIVAFWQRNVLYNDDYGGIERRFTWKADY
jgi:hypothetical protein